MKTNYKMKNYGQITKFEAGVFYRNWKQGNVEAHKEFADMLYKEVDFNFQFASERYNNDRIFYGSIENLTKKLLEEDYQEAQKIIDYIQENRIKYSTERSVWYKYK